MTMINENLSTWQRARQLCETQPSILRHPLEVPILLSNNFHHHHPGNVYDGAETSQVPRPSYTSELGNLTMPRHNQHWSPRHFLPDHPHRQHHHCHHH